MALHRAVEEKLSSPINFRNFALTSLMLAATAFLLQGRPAEMQMMRLARPVRIALIDATQPAPQVMNPEAGMSSRELMQRWEPTIADAAKRFKIPAAWIRNVMRSESGGRIYLHGQQITSNKGAMGLMQVMPGTWREMQQQYRLGDDPFDPQNNVYAGAAYLRWLHGKYGFPAMFAAYNTGPGNLEDHLHHGAPLPRETRNYVAGITRALGKGTDWLSRASHRAGGLMVTAPNGKKIALDKGKISGVRAALPGEFAPGVTTVISLGKIVQGVRESQDVVLAAITSAKG